MTSLYLEIKASSCFHSKCVFFKSHYLHNYSNIQYLIKVKLLFSALVFTIISYIYIITYYHNLDDGGVGVPIKEGFITTMTENNTITERPGKVKIREFETRA